MQSAEAASDAPQAEGDAPRADGDAPRADGDARLVFRNTMYLGIAEVLSMPISILINALMGRYLGPEIIGNIYLATTTTSLAFLGVTWGHTGSLPAAVVLHRSNSGKLLGSSLAWRLMASVVAYALVAGGGHFAGYTSDQQWAVGLVFLTNVVITVISAYQEVIRGFERTDIAAYTRVGTLVASTLLVIPVLLLGGQMRVTLFAQSVAAVIALIVMLRATRSVGIGKIEWDPASFKELMVKGTPFVFFGVALVLQPNVDAFYLAKLSPTEVVGWYAVSQKLIGFLLVPASALIGALYPTLCRLHATDLEGFKSTVRDSVHTVCLLVVPVAFGCALYPDIGISIFGRDAFRPAEDTLRVASAYLFLVYFSMPIGIALVAAGRQKAWTVIQLLCVANSALLDPLLIGYFQKNYHNGGLGLATASTLSEAMMVTAGLILMPRGVLDRRFAKTFVLAILAGLAMATVAWALRGLPSLVAAPVAVLAYGLALYFSGGVNNEQLAGLVNAVRRKLNRNRAVA